MQLFRIVIFALASAAFALGADIDGKWVGDVNTNDGVVKLTLAIKSAGGTFTGTVTTHIGEQVIKEGKISGDEITWYTIYERDGNSMKILNKAKVAGSEMKVTTTVEGRDIVLEYSVKKES